MSNHQHEDHGVEDLDVPESDAEHVVGGITAPKTGLKIDFVGLKVT